MATYDKLLVFKKFYNLSKDLIDLINSSIDRDEESLNERKQIEVIRSLTRMMHDTHPVHFTCDKKVTRLRR
ncbi:MAG: hypothetical protein LBN93_05835 [Candidatus Symbiothrix sp.]|jgi:hypothetical protein|nr:hypothetical protein [Candidatus Symbiothrix sp.]